MRDVASAFFIFSLGGEAAANDGDDEDAHVWKRPHTHPKKQQQGDNDPVDLVEIGSEQLKLGGVYKVKPLG